MHPRDTRIIKGQKWHKEDSGLSLVEAKALFKHLHHTEDKRAIRVKTKNGYEVWWTKQ